MIVPWHLSLNYKNQTVLTDELNWKIQRKLHCQTLRIISILCFRASEYKSNETPT